MFMSKVAPRGVDLSVGELARMTRNDGYRTHQSLWGLFADHPERQRDFLYRQEDPRPGERFFYVVSSREPHPEATPWNVETKPYAPRVAEGERLAFMVRVNPVRSRAEAVGSRGKRHDIVMDAKRRLRAEGGEVDLDALARREGMAWLEQRAPRHGFRPVIESLRVHGYRQHRLYKGRRSPAAHGEGNGRREIRFSTLDFEGLLTVADLNLFLQTLMGGLGPAKGFGCGLMLVRRA